MTPQPTKPSPPAAPDAANTRPLWLLLALAAVVPLTATVILYRANVPLGCPGRFVYLYSPVVTWRLQSLVAIVMIAPVLAASVWLAAGSTAGRRRLGLTLAVLGTMALATWSYFAPPEHIKQHIFNAHSPSHDGAFVQEALRADRAGAYVREFPQRARASIEEMRGTRVVSNPPGATLLAMALRHGLAVWPGAGAFASSGMREVTFEVLRPSVELGFVFFWALTALWAASSMALYAVGRQFFAPSSALTYALCCTFSPMTVFFTPGKDPAQLLTVAVPLALWLIAARHGLATLAVAAGVTFTLACLASLVHVWVAAIVLSATLFAMRQWIELRAVLLKGVLPAAAGIVATGFGVWVFWGLDLIATFRAVAESQAAVTRGPDAMPYVWQMLGVPLFLLFAGPALWSVALWWGGRSTTLEPARDRESRFGRLLLIGSGLVMLGTVGFTNLETPRLWIPFVPLLLLGGFLQFRGLRRPSRRAAVLLAGLVLAQVVVTAAQWSLMDPRESENRLLSEEFFG